MAADDHIRYRVADGIATITFNRPEKRNAITFAMADTFVERLADAGASPDVRVVVIEGAGPSFTAGVDVTEQPDRQDPAATSLAEDEAEISASAGRWSQLWSLPKPVIVKARGHCVGWGLEIALYADFVLASLDCQFFFPSVRNGSGLPDSSMAIYHLGPQWSKRLLFTGDAVDGLTAARIGLVLEAVPDDELDGAVDASGGPHGRRRSGARRPEQAGLEPCDRPDGAGPAPGVLGPRQCSGPARPRGGRVEPDRPRAGSARGHRLAGWTPYRSGRKFGGRFSMNARAPSVISGELTSQPVSSAPCCSAGH